MPELDLVGVSKSYGNIQALTDISLHVENKEYVCILGPSGCGKSTLIRCIAGINKPDSGKILIDGESVEQIPIEDRRIGYVFQDIALFPHMSVRDNISYGLAVRHAESTEITTVTNEMLDLINMRDRSKAYPRELSGGAQQKLAVARAIATGSHLFLLDEPLGALDTIVRAELRYELRKLASDLGLTVIHVTHDQEEALSIA
ncbi:MAG: ABC transporter ATP-binding protein, partial [Candidatus Bathyarchaeia archaeon]